MRRRNAGRDCQEGWEGREKPSWEIGRDGYGMGRIDGKVGHGAFSYRMS